MKALKPDTMLRPYTTVEARKLERHSPDALKVKYKGS